MSNENNTDTSNNVDTTKDTNSNSKTVYVDKDKGLVYLNNKIINKPHTVQHHVPK